MGVLGVLCLAAVPVLGNAITYTFSLTAGEVIVSKEGYGSTTSEMAGTFAITIYQSDLHIGQSDTFVLEDCGLWNTDAGVLRMPDFVTATFSPGSIRLTDFMQPEASHLGSGGVAVANSDVFFEGTVILSGATSGAYSSRGWVGELTAVDVLITTSVTRSDVATASLGLAFSYAAKPPDLPPAFTITLDLIVNVEGTVHVVPDPGLGGLAALGLGGAGAWLRRRGSEV